MGLFFRNKSVPKTKSTQVTKNKDDWDVGYEKGYPLWQKGEAERKAGNYVKALALYNRARDEGYLAPALYNSYAMTYRKLKDVDSEIMVLEEGIRRMGSAKGNYKTGIAKLRDQLEKAKAKQ